jgi:hypothetical protein
VGLIVRIKPFDSYTKRMTMLLSSAKPEFDSSSFVIFSDVASGLLENQGAKKLIVEIIMGPC